MSNKFLNMLMLLSIFCSGCIDYSDSEKNKNMGNVITTVENESTIDDQMLKIDKSSYEVGEIIKGRFEFENDIFVQPYMSIYRFENNSWKYLGMWDYNGTLYEGFGAIPPSIKLNSKVDSPLFIKWNQKMIEDSISGPLDESIPITQAKPGKYKIQISYGNQSDCSKTIAAEFIIE